MKLLNVEQRTDEWLALRRERIGASDAPIIMGESPYRNSYQLWRDKILGQTQEINGAMRRGISLEDEARRSFEEMTEIKVGPAVVEHWEYDWMIASLDGLDESQAVAVEIKCPKQSDHALAQKGEIPPKYKAQLQHQMEVCGLNTMLYYSYNGSSGALVEVKKDHEYTGRLLTNEKEFYRSMIRFEPPECPSIMRTDKSWIEASDRWKKAKEAAREAEEYLLACKNVLIELSGGQNSQDEQLALHLVTKVGTVDYGSIVELQGLDLSPYRRKSISYWEIREKKGATS